MVSFQHTCIERQHLIHSYRFRSVSGSAWQNSWYQYTLTSFQQYHCRLYYTRRARTATHIRSVSGSAWQNSWYRYMPHHSRPLIHSYSSLPYQPSTRIEQQHFIHLFIQIPISIRLRWHTLVYATPRASFVSSRLPLLCPASPSTIYFIYSSILQRRQMKA